MNQELFMNGAGWLYEFSFE